LDNSLEKATETFRSMQPPGHPEGEEEEGHKCTWYASLDPEKLSVVCSSAFPTGDGETWAQWIGFLVICVHPDKRTVSYVIGADND
jgi:hypothetical protein